MEDFNQMKSSINGAALTSEHNPDDLKIINDLRSTVDELTVKLRHTEVELEHQHHERMCMIADNRALREKLESLRCTKPQNIPKPGDICLDTEAEFPKEYYARALEGLMADALELLSGIHILSCSLRGTPSEESLRQLNEKLDIIG